MKVFYARCSTVEQNEARQIQTAKEIGADKVFVDKASGKNTDRPELKKMLDFVREGDTLYCSDFSRLARNTRDLLSIVEQLQAKGVQFISMKEAVDTGTPQGRFMLTVFGAMAELERETILQRQREGIAIAKAQGKYKGRQKTPIDTGRFRAVCARWRAGEITAVKAMELTQLKANTFYRRVKEYGM
jgi:DNA invertase Pin-like site-specific DNA recombinase